MRVMGDEKATSESGDAKEGAAAQIPQLEMLLRNFRRYRCRRFQVGALCAAACRPFRLTGARDRVKEESVDARILRKLRGRS